MQHNARAVKPTALSVTRAGRYPQWGWLALVLTVALVVITYLVLSLAVSDDPLLMPLDDTYIHFQYARQMAQGQPMVYYDGDPATSGGTSLIYPPLLALGYALGFSGWMLSTWALGLGIVCFLGAVALVYLIGRDLLAAHGSYPPLYAFLMALAFAVSGPFVWAALSGMETLLFVCLMLLTLYALQRDQLYLTVAAAFLVTLTRPEGVAVAGIAVVALALRIAWPGTWGKRIRRALLLALPVLAALIQPAINWLATGSVSSSGMQAKSQLYNTSVPLADRLGDVLDFFVRIWKELLTGHSADWGTFVPWLLVVMAFSGLALGVALALRQRRVTVAVVMLAWMLALTAGVATLDTAFWQFKRYQLPVMALLFPLAAWGLALQGAWFARDLRRRWAQWAIPVIILIASALTGVSFAHKYVVNVRVVRDQQVPMARWVRDNLPNGARIGVHDVGVMGYFSEHPLYDVVGLTLPGPSEAWRQGPGAIYEYMAHSDYRPEYFAIYPDVQGLRYLLNAGVMGEVLAEFSVELPADNVAAALDYQAVYVADWSDTRDAEMVAQTTTLDYLARLDGAVLVDQVDVANLTSETAHDYSWWQVEQPPGFVTEVYRHVYRACGLDDEAACWATDGGRVLTGGEDFTLQTVPGQDVLLVTRVHGRESVSLEISVNGTQVASRVQPAVAGRWVEIVTLIPGAQITGSATSVRIECSGVYMPYYHWAYQGQYVPGPTASSDPVATFGEAGQARLAAYTLDDGAGQLTVDLTWQGPALLPGDGVVFVHLYNKGETATEPLAQVVARPAGDVLPPANWLPGTVADHYVVALPEDLSPGTYVVALGMFDNRTGQRYAAAAPTLTVDDGRLFIGEITIEEFPSED